MVINTNQVLPSGFSIDYEVLESVSESYLVKGDEVQAYVQGKVLPSGPDDYVFSGSLRIACTLICDKCLKEIPFSLASSVCEKFTATEAAEGWPISDGTLDFTEAIRANICALLPMKILCTNDCRGLCPMCGKNLNKDDCTCEKPKDSRFAQLDSFFKEEV